MSPLATLPAATLVGSQTYGKGRIQSVIELHDGSALLVTVAKYRTPHGTEIDHRGIAPDAACVAAPALAAAPPLKASAPGAGAAGAAAAARGVAASPAAPPSALSATAASGLPLSLLEPGAVQQQLGSDGCVLTAQAMLRRAHAPSLAALPPQRQL